MNLQLYTNAELIDFVEARKHYKLGRYELEHLLNLLDQRLGELRYGG